MVAAADPAEPRERRPSAFALGVSALFALFLLLAAGAVVQGRINHDEGWYLYAAGRVLEGALPYRDFAYFQAPLLPFVHAPAQLLFGPGVVVGRLTSLALSIGTVALGARLAFVHGGRLAALFFLGILCLTPQQLWAFTTTRTEPLVAFWLMLAAFFLLARPVSARASGAALAAMVLAVGTRVSVMPAALLVRGRRPLVTAWHMRPGDRPPDLLVVVVIDKEARVPSRMGDYRIAMPNTIRREEA